MNSATISRDAAGAVRLVVRLLGDGSVKAGVARAARLCGLSERRVRAYLHREVRHPLAWEVRALQARLDAAVAERQRRADAELAALLTALERLG